MSARVGDRPRCPACGTRPRPGSLPLIDPRLVPPRALDIDVYFDDDPDGLSVAEMVQWGVISAHEGEAALLVDARRVFGLRGQRLVYEVILAGREPEPAGAARLDRGTMRD